jgi:hypothetical protein
MTQTRVVRFFLKPNGEHWLDLPLGPNQTMQQIFSLMKYEGAIVHDLFIMPQDALLYAGMLIFENGQATKPLDKLSPTLTVVPFPGVFGVPPKPDDPPGA